MITVEMLVYLDAISKYQSLTAAAKALNVTPPAISHSLNKLSDELGREVHLYKRTSKGIVMTDIGKAIAGMANSILFDLERIKMIANQNNKPVTTYSPILNEIYLCSNTGIIDCINDLPLSIYERYPYVDFSIIDLPFHKILRNVNEDVSNFGLCYMLEDNLSILANYENINYSMVASCGLGIKVAKNSKHIENSKTNISWQELAYIPIVNSTTNSSLQEQVQPLLRLHNAEKASEINAATSISTIKIVEKDLAVCIAPLITINENNELGLNYNIRTIPIEEKTMIQLVFLYNKQTDLQTTKVLHYLIKHEYRKNESEHDIF
ncbi:MAG: LysR family transcriptional regulator [Peptococcaceae bacterium]